MLGAVQALYAGARLAIKVEGRVGEAVYTHTGVRQGCLMYADNITLLSVQPSGLQHDRSFGVVMYLYWPCNQSR
jgi:hypothetical protein